MSQKISRRGFVKSSLLASAAIPLGLDATRAGATPAAASDTSQEALPKGKIGSMEFSRLMMGGNLIGGYSHSRDLPYVGTLMRRYNTAAKIRETLELGESKGITSINTWVMQDNSQIFDHWKAGGKLKWFSQVRLDAGGGFSQIQQAVDQGAVGIHLTGDACENLLHEDKFDKVAETLEFIRSKKRLAGVAAHDLAVIVECEKRKLDVDFYQKTFHTREYFTAQRPEDKAALGANDNAWCTDAQAVVDVFARINKPWIAFKILAAGAIQPRAAFPHAFNSGADFILVGMFDWQVDDDVKLARRVIGIVADAGSKRTRPWH